MTDTDQAIAYLAAFRMALTEAGFPDLAQAAQVEHRDDDIPALVCEHWERPGCCEALDRAMTLAHEEVFG